MENMEIDAGFWKGRSVFLTGHTGFKGGWLALWLSEMGANVHGYSLEAPTQPNFFSVINLSNLIQSSTIGDIRDLSKLKESVKAARPSVIFHMAAQPLVRQSYIDPIETFTTNILGTINVFEATKNSETVKAIINITTDKCYENKENNKSFEETDPLGGYDPYSSSKACSEIITSAYRNSFFSKMKKKLASVRAGNVIGGGDWAKDRLVPDFFRSIDRNKILRIRSPQAVRPWQHVLDPLSGYLMLAEKLFEHGDIYAEPWNFGPEQSEAKTVSWVLNCLSEKFTNANWEEEKKEQPYEANLLKLDISKAKSRLGWAPRWSVETAIDNTISWYQAFKENKDMIEFSVKQIKSFQAL
ncbi:CDP-glucose 4,6-dehydratase [Candidatus Pelagibacter ubique]|nr:CDP-glucose 4,6-dehydratase [Candidatus Pelagibacter ubique]